MPLSLCRCLPHPRPFVFPRMLVCQTQAGASPLDWAANGVLQLAVQQAIVARLATIMLAPPGAEEHQAVITITPAGNAALRAWAQALPRHVADAAAHNTTGPQ